MCQSQGWEGGLCEADRPSVGTRKGVPVTFSHEIDLVTILQLVITAGFAVGMLVVRLQIANLELRISERIDSKVGKVVERVDELVVSVARLQGMIEARTSTVNPKAQVNYD